MKNLLSKFETVENIFKGIYLNQFSIYDYWLILQLITINIFLLNYSLTLLELFL